MATYSNSIVVYPDSIFDSSLLLSAGLYDKDNVGGKYGVQIPNLSIRAPLPDYSVGSPGDEFLFPELGGPAYPTLNRSAITFSNSVPSDHYIENVLRGVIYYSPVEINNFILETTLYYVKIWNATYSDVIISNMSVDSAEGTSFSPWIYPVGVGEDQYIPYDLIVYVDGPPSQNTTYTLTIDGVDFTTTILGSRIMPFAFPINWEHGYKMQMAYNTVVQENRSKREQRRSLHSKAYKSVDVTITVDTVDKQDKLASWARVSQNRVIGVPLFQEAMFSTTDIATGQTIVIVEEDISEYHFLPNSSYVLVVDYSLDVYEIKLLSNVNTATRTLTFSQGVSVDYDKSTTAIYTLFFTLVESLTFNVESDVAMNVSIKFIEFKKDI